MEKVRSSGGSGTGWKLGKVSLARSQSAAALTTTQSMQGREKGRREPGLVFGRIDLFVRSSRLACRVRPLPSSLPTTDLSASPGLPDSRSSRPSLMSDILPGPTLVMDRLRDGNAKREEEGKMGSVRLNAAHGVQERRARCSLVRLDQERERRERERGAW